MATTCCIACDEGEMCERDTDWGILLSDTSCQIAGHITVNVTVPGNIDPTVRPIRVWLVRPTPTSSWVVGGRIG